MKRTALVGFCLYIIVPACWSIDSLDSEDVNEDKYWGEYSVSFDAEDGDLRYYAQFRAGGSTGTTIRLSEPSTIAVDGKAMELFDGDEAWLNVEGSYYFLNESVAAPAGAYAYLWTRLDGSSYENVVLMADPIGVVAPAIDATFSKAEGLTVIFNPPVGPDEEVRCSIDGEGEYDSEWVNAGDSCVFTAPELEEMQPGSATVYVRRRLRGEIQNGHDDEGGTINSYYTSTRVDVTVAE